MVEADPAASASGGLGDTPVLACCTLSSFFLCFFSCFAVCLHSKFDFLAFASEKHASVLCVWTVVIKYMYIYSHISYKREKN